jgi:thioredoxin-related protein
MKYRYILSLILGMIVCPLFSGCNDGGVAQVLSAVDDTKQPVAFLSDRSAGLEIARQEKKPILLFFSVPDNAGSQRMMKTTFCDEEIKRLAEWLVCVYVDGSQESALCESLGISSFPTIILSNVDGVEVCRLVGKQTPDQLAVQIHVLLQVAAQHPPAVRR